MKKGEMHISTTDQKYLKVMSVTNLKKYIYISKDLTQDLRDLLSLQLIHLLFTEASSEIVSVEG